MIHKEKPENFVPDIEVVGCLVENNGKILLLHRHDHKSQGGKWGIPAGKIDHRDNNDRKLAMIRELEEETGLIVNEEDLVFHKTFFVEYPDKKYFYHYHVINIKNDFDVCIEENEHQNYCWATPEEALDMSLVLDEDYCLKDFYGIK
ncbi:MAG TPA: NUDIX domain-containing protein [Candidatus Paceibacterota bacterium]|nr:NUDIX domain-containing protein [Candidatus Paceibacterota bacterium]